MSVGISEGDLREANENGIFSKMVLGIQHPSVFFNRHALKEVYLLSRRRHDIFGENDVAFFDLAEACVAHIDVKDLVQIPAKDTMEKGFLNTFNHITAQAFVTSFYSEEIADFIADAHERHHMPALIHGNFTTEQLADKTLNPIDNYVDIVNNEWGQELGKRLKAKYQIHQEKRLTPDLLANYLNDVQHYYRWAFQINLSPFRADDEVIEKFARKYNRIKAESDFNI
ncbi:MAG: hypothetical protein Salg2KO_23210 [Salibacteraceae bacterium]